MLKAFPQSDNNGALVPRDTTVRMQVLPRDVVEEPAKLCQEDDGATKTTPAYSSMLDSDFSSGGNWSGAESCFAEGRNALNHVG